jgi:hypothetical protein
MARNLKITAFCALLALAGSLSLQAQAQTITGSRGGLSYVLTLDGKNVVIELKAKAKGWVALGLDPERGMKGADFVIGYVAGGKASARDDFGVSPFAHASDESQGGSNDILSFKGTEADGVTTLSLVLSAASKDSRDRPWSKGKHIIILAAADGDDFNSKHSMKATFDIEIK